MAEFENGVIFREATLKWAKFKDITFKGAVDFTDVVFKLLLFIRTTFEDIAIFKIKDLEEVNCELKTSDKNRFAVFNLTMFKHPENVWFVDFPLTNTSFLLTDVSKTKIIANFNSSDRIFSDELQLKRCSKCVEKCEIRYLDGYYILDNFTDMNHILPECIALKVLQPYLKQETVLAEYRSLRRSFENNRTYQEASNLFVKEMKLLGKSLKSNDSSLKHSLDVNFEKCFHKLYGVFSYGESVFLPILVMLATIFIIPFVIYFRIINKIIDLIVQYVPVKFLDTFINVTANFFQIPRDLGGLEIPIRLIGAITLGLLFIAFRRKFERK